MSQVRAARQCIAVVVAMLLAAPALALGPTTLKIDFDAVAGGMPLITDGRVAPVQVDASDDPAVIHAAAAFQDDLRLVAGGSAASSELPVIVGTIGHSQQIDALIAAHKLDVSGVSGRWEAYVQQVVVAPTRGVARALVIAGADRRGTVFGVYDLSARIGVSPWVWWADVPVQHHDKLYVNGRAMDAPVVKYRGIFINDEEPALGSWAREKFGGVNAKFYAHVYDLILRLKGNYLWPAMWGKSLWQDDPESARLAQQLGIVLGTSHHEPMMRAHVEWQRGNGGPWDYTRNAATLRSFWQEGLERTRGNEQLVTIGMRGDGDEPMTKGTAIPLLERIVADQRKIISQVTGKPAAATPQVWALYKEVQDYYDQGMRVPDDVTLLFSDDNWGNLRRLPSLGARRAGGYGVYYHFDYVGDPRNYKWLNTNQIERIWQQLELAHAHGADRLWIANVGDIKPMELPISFLMDLAWNPNAISASQLPDYYTRWAAQQFSTAPAMEIGKLLANTSRLNAQLKPELIDASYYTTGNPLHRPTDTDYTPLLADSARIATRLAPNQRDAFYELVAHPIEAMANLHRLYHAVANNQQTSSDCLGSAQAARDAFAEDAKIRARYESVAGGKWHFMMAQTHIGYTGWQEPSKDMPPPLRESAACMGNAVAVKWAVNHQTTELVIDATQFVHQSHLGEAHWQIFPNLGIWGNAITLMPQTLPPFAASKGPRLDYNVALSSRGIITVKLLASPSLDVRGGEHLRYAVAVDDEAPQVVNLLDGPQNAWATAVAQNIRTGETLHHIAAAGPHRLHIWAIDPYVTVQRIVVTPAQP